jgi:hypothetical protein
MGRFVRKGKSLPEIFQKRNLLIQISSSDTFCGQTREDVVDVRHKRFRRRNPFGQSDSDVESGYGEDLGRLV